MFVLLDSVFGLGWLLWIRFAACIFFGTIVALFCFRLGFGFTVWLDGVGLFTAGVPFRVVTCGSGVLIA